MIVASLLLILVAVTLLVLGLTGGSSALLIASIAASLLAAIALVVGARSAASARRAAEGRGEPALDAESDFSTSGRSSARPSEPVSDEFEYGTPAAGYDEPASGYAEPAFGHAETPRVNDPGSMMDDPSAPEEGLASAGSMHARGASREDAESALRADAAYQETYGAPDPDLDDLDSGYHEESGYNDAVLTDEDAYERELAARAGGDDYDQASSYIGGARSETPGADAWRRGPAESPEAARDAAAAGSGRPAEELSREFAEPDAEDPDDEPLPQAVKPADAVRVAQLDDEVMVVDGRPRYHMADCAHLIGKLTDPLPVSEAVELGFSPCGLCRPVDRLVAQAAHR
jgi:hypothetical protein